MSRYIDTHVHVWTDDLRKYPLGPGFKPERMPLPRFLPEDALRHANASGVNRIVLVQISFYRFDNRYLLDAIRARPETFSGIAMVDWKAPRPDDVMRELARVHVRGFRIPAGGNEPEAWLDGDGMERMFRCGGKERLAICPLLTPAHLPALSRMCAKFPDTPVIIDHLARIGASGPVRDEDVAALCSLARHRNVMVKVSAFNSLGAKKPPHLDLAPLIKRVHEAFGARRLMWGSDTPFQTQHETYEDSIALIRDRLDFLSAEDKDWMLRRTAEEFFWK
ncbi:MAG: amidohydrolase family protein [Verrucomicrobia bacterium]|nr:amidohydrolase family protein [Verrucomicrobiota bacterium]